MQCNAMQCNAMQCNTIIPKFLMMLEWYRFQELAENSSPLRIEPVARPVARFLSRMTTGPEGVLYKLLKFKLVQFLVWVSFFSG